MTKESVRAFKTFSVLAILVFVFFFGFKVGTQQSDPPPVPPVTTGSDNHTTTAPVPPTPPTPTNTTVPTGPPPTAPKTTLVYGMVNVAYPGVNLSLPGWVLTFRNSGTDYNSTLTLQWNQWRTNYWFTYAIVVTSNIGYTVTVSQPTLGTWATVQGSITPSGQNDNENFVTTGNAF